MRARAKFLRGVVLWSTLEQITVFIFTILRDYRGLSRLKVALLINQRNPGDGLYRSG